MFKDQSRETQVKEYMWNESGIRKKGKFLWGGEKGTVQEKGINKLKLCVQMQ